MGPDAGGDGFQITGQANFDGAAEACYILRQRSSRKFEIADSATGLKTMVASLSDQAITAPGLIFHVLVNGTDHASIIRAHRVSTFEGNSFVWSDITKEATVVDDVVDGDLGDDVDVNP